MLNFENLFNFSFSSQKYSQVISYSTNNLVEQLMIPIIGEQKWSTLPSVYLYQTKNYRFQNLELVKILFLEKYDNFKNNNF